MTGFEQIGGRQVLQGEDQAQNNNDRHVRRSTESPEKISSTIVTTFFVLRLETHPNKSTGKAEEQQQWRDDVGEYWEGLRPPFLPFFI